MEDIVPLFVGYDTREKIAFDVCRVSAQMNSSVPLHIQPVVQSALRKAGLYRRETKWGVPYADYVDGAPFSTEFTFSRFLVPTLMQWNGWAIFCDCDFLWRGDIAELWALRDDRYAVMCVPHIHAPLETEKMDGRAQYCYARKNWSSLMLINCGHPGNARLTVEDVNTRTKKWLHGLRWLNDDEIGSIPEAWNWLAGYSKSSDPKAVHFTSGTPSMPGHENAPYAHEWWGYAEQAGYRL